MNVDTQNPYVPAWWLPNAHLQTLYPYFFKEHFDVPTRKERFELPDGDFMDGIWTDKPEGPTVVLFHGLQGSSDSHYINSLMHHIYHQTNWNALAINFRCCGGEVNRLHRQYHSGDTEDFRFIINLLKQRNPSIPIATVGFSLGANIMLKLFGELKQNNLCETGIAICPPFDLMHTAKMLQQGSNRLYEKLFLKDIKQTYMLKAEAGVASKELISTLNEIQSLIDLDEKITAPLHGFESLNQYYEESSCLNYLSGIRKPTLIIIAKNDPVINYSLLPSSQDLSSQTHLEVYEEGGHVGFMTGSAHKPHYWLDDRIMEHLSQYLPLGILEHKRI